MGGGRGETKNVIAPPIPSVCPHTCGSIGQRPMRLSVPKCTTTTKGSGVVFT